MIYTLYYVHDPMCSWCYAFKSTLDTLKKHLDSNIKLVYVVGGLASHSDEIMPKDMQEKIEDIWYEIEKIQVQNLTMIFGKTVNQGVQPI